MISISYRFYNIPFLCLVITFSIILERQNVHWRIMVSFLFWCNLTLNQSQCFSVQKAFSPWPQCWHSWLISVWVCVMWLCVSVCRVMTGGSTGLPSTPACLSLCLEPTTGRSRSGEWMVSHSEIISYRSSTIPCPIFCFFFFFIVLFCLLVAHIRKQKQGSIKINVNWNYNITTHNV